MKTLRKTVCLCAALLAALFLLNTASGLIPVEAMQKNLIDSAEYYLSLSDTESTFVDHVKGDGRTSEHMYADAILMNIISSFDRSSFWQSTLTVPYYYNGTGAASSLLESASGMTDEINRHYSRYWHGTLMFTRLELLFTDAEGIHIIHLVFLLMLVAFFTFLCIRKRYWSLAVGYLFAFCFTRSWYSFYSIEYMSCFSLSLLSASAVMLLPRERLTGETPVLLFALTAVATVFFDFLTNETLTCLVPLICLTVRRYREENASFRTLLLHALELGAVWLAAWVVPFALRWLLSAVTPGAQTLSDILGRAGGWINRDSENLPLPSLRLSALLLCLKRLFPFEKPTETFLASGAFYLLFWALLLFVRATGEKSWKPLLVLALLALLPYARYLVLASHTYGHPRFTYRAQVSSIFAMSTLVLCALRPNRSLRNKKELRK